MRKIFIFLLPIFVACQSVEEEVIEKFPSGKTKVVVKYKVKNNKKVKQEEIKYFEKGTIEVQGKYDDNEQREGNWKYWYDNGNLWSECEYKNGSKEGKLTVYYKNGQKLYEGHNKDNKPVGKWVFWDEKGNVKTEKDY